MSIVLRLLLVMALCGPALAGCLRPATPDAQPQGVSLLQEALPGHGVRPSILRLYRLERAGESLLVVEGLAENTDAATRTGIFLVADLLDAQGAVLATRLVRAGVILPEDGMSLLGAERIEARLYDAPGTVSASSPLAKGRAARFQAVFRGPPAAAAKVRIDVASVREGPGPNSGGAAESLARISLYRVRQYYVNNQYVGQIFVIEGAAVNKLDRPISSIELEAAIYNRRGAVVSSRKFLAGNALTLFNLQILPQLELQARLEDEAGVRSFNTSVPPGDAAPFMVVFFRVPEDTAEFGIRAVGFQEAGGAVRKGPQEAP